MKLSKPETIFLLILFLAAFLRFYHISDQVPLIGDQGRDFIAARDFVLTGNIPLLGIASSVPRFHQGPLYIWLIATIFKLFGFSPLGPIIFASALGLITVGLTYILTDRHFGRLPAIIASLTLAASPLAVLQSRMAFHTNAIPLFALIYLYSLIYLLQNKHSNLFWPSLAFALLFQFELVVAPLMLLIPLVMFITKYKPRIHQLASALLGLIIGLLPQLVYDLTHHFQQVGLFIVWIGYRLAGFVGFGGGHTASPAKFITVIKLIFTYSQKFFIWQSAPITVLILLTLSIGLFKLRKKLTPLVMILLAWMAIMLISFIVMGNASEAYFPALFVPVAILLGLSINTYSHQARFLLTVSIILLALINTSFLVTTSFLTGPVSSTNPLNTYGAPLSEQLSITTLISQQASNNYSLTALGPGSQFPSFLDNYRYLLWWQTGQAESPTGQKVWVQPSYLTIRPTDTISYSFLTTTISFPLNNSN